jgi:hypothetical protein
LRGMGDDCRLSLLLGRRRRSTHVGFPMRGTGRHGVRVLGRDMGRGAWGGSSPGVGAVPRHDVPSEHPGSRPSAAQFVASRMHMFHF